MVADALTEDGVDRRLIEDICERCRLTITHDVQRFTKSSAHNAQPGTMRSTGSSSSSSTTINQRSNGPGCTSSSLSKSSYTAIDGELSARTCVSCPGAARAHGSCGGTSLLLGDGRPRQDFNQSDASVNQAEHRISATTTQQPTINQRAPEISRNEVDDEDPLDAAFAQMQAANEDQPDYIQQSMQLQFSRRKLHMVLGELFVSGS